MQSNLLAMINNRNTKAVAISCLPLVNRLWQVKRQLNWPAFAEY